MINVVLERNTHLQMELCITFTKENLCPASRQKEKGQRALLSAQNNPKNSGIFSGDITLIHFTGPCLGIEYCAKNLYRSIALYHLFLLTLSVKY